MPVLPNFSAFAPTPNNANAWLGGAALAQRDKQFQAQLAMEQQKLDQQAASAQMEHAIQQQRLEETSLRAHQEMNIKSQYDQQMLGLRSQQLKGEEAALKLKTEEAAQQFQARQRIQDSPPDERIDSILRNSAAAGVSIPAGAFTSFMEGKDPNRAEAPRTFDLDGLPGFRAVEIGDGRFQVVNRDASQLPTRRADLAERRFESTQQAQEFRQRQVEYTNTVKQHADDKEGYRFAMRLVRPDPGEVTKAQRAQAESWTKRAAKLSQMLEEMSSESGGANATAPEIFAPSSGAKTNSATAGKYKVTW